MVRSGGWVVAVLLAALARPAAAEAWQRCPGSGWEVTGADAQEHALVCGGVTGAAAVLASCGVETVAATHIRVVDALPLSCGAPVWGLFDAGTDEITLGNPAICVAEAPEGSLFHLIEAPLAFVAITAHEATHALLHAGGLGADRHLEHEYIAAVVQMQVLPVDARAGVLAPLRIGSHVGPWQLNPFVHALRPDLFAGLAWRHFQGEADGCAFLRALAEGRQRLPDYSSF
jgi:hypothetical protein